MTKNTQRPLVFAGGLFLFLSLGLGPGPAPLGAQTPPPTPAATPEAAAQVKPLEPRAEGLAAYQKGLYARAVQAFLEAVGADPGDWLAWEEMGDAYYKMNRWKKALEAYGQSLSLHPDNPTLSLWINQVQAQMGSLSSNSSPPLGATAPASPGPSPGTDSSGGFSTVKNWFRLEGGYNLSTLGEMAQSADAFNLSLSHNGYPGSVLQSGSGSLFGMELGFQIAPFNGLGFGLHFLRTADYSSNFNQPGTSPLSFEDETLQPQVLGLTLDDYWFLNDKGGRFFLGLGVGYYEGTVRVMEQYDFTSSGGGAANFIGDLHSSALGFQVSLGRDWALNPDMALCFFVRGRIVSITAFRGMVVNQDGSTAQFGLERGADGVLDVDDVSNIGSNGEQYATLDFTGLDAMASFVFYSY